MSDTVKIAVGRAGPPFTALVHVFVGGLKGVAPKGLGTDDGAAGVVQAVFGDVALVGVQLVLDIVFRGRLVHQQDDPAVAQAPQVVHADARTTASGSVATTWPG